MASLARLNFVTLGVTDLARATAFYAALGWTRSTASQAEIAFMRGDGDTGLILWSYDALAEDAALPPGRGSFGGQALAVNVPEEADVSTALAAAEAAGGRHGQAGTVSRALRSPWYSMSFWLAVTMPPSWSATAAMSRPRTAT